MGKTCFYPIVIESDKNNIELYNLIYYKYIVLNMNMQSWGSLVTHKGSKGNLSQVHFLDQHYLFWILDDEGIMTLMELFSSNIVYWVEFKLN